MLSMLMIHNSGGFSPKQAMRSLSSRGGKNIQIITFWNFSWTWNSTIPTHREQFIQNRTFNFADSFLFFPLLCCSEASHAAPLCRPLWIRIATTWHAAAWSFCHFYIRWCAWHLPKDCVCFLGLWLFLYWYTQNWVCVFYKCNRHALFLYKTCGYQW